MACRSTTDANFMSFPWWLDRAGPPPDPKPEPPPATPSPAPAPGAIAYLVTARRVSLFRRCGINFTDKPTRVAIDRLTLAQWALVLGDARNLSCVPVLG